MTEFGLNIEKHIFSKLHIIKILKKIEGHLNPGLTEEIQNLNPGLSGKILNLPDFPLTEMLH